MCNHNFQNLLKDPFFPQRILGTPTEKNWPGVSQLQDYKTDFPRWNGEGLKKAVPQMDEVALDLLEVNTLCRNWRIIIWVLDNNSTDMVHKWLWINQCDFLTALETTYFFVFLSKLALLVYHVITNFFFCLLQKMLIYNPAKRISAKAALDHPYFNDLDLSTLPASKQTAIKGNMLRFF